MDQQYIGRYRVTGRLGVGGMGTVLRAVDEVRHRDVAIKLPNDMDSKVISRLQRECDVLAQLEHHHIVQVYGSGSDPDLPFYIVMEFVDGTTVEDLLRQQPGGLEPRQALKIAQSVAEALAYAHKPPLRVVHRDIKPGNILIRAKDGVAKVTDFGIAAVLSEHTGSTAVGTMAYVPPEQAAGRGADERSDLYSLGAVLYEMLTGQRPPRLAVNPARPPSSLPGVGERLGALAGPVDRLTLGLLESDSNLRRPQRAAEVVAELSALLEGRPSSASLSMSASYDPTVRASAPPSFANEPPRSNPFPSAPPSTSYGAYPPPPMPAPRMPMPPMPVPQMPMAPIPQPMIMQQPMVPVGRPVPVIPVVPMVRVMPVVPVIVRPPSSGKATASLVLGIFAILFSWFLLGGLLGVLAAIFGHLALGDVRRSGGQLSGHGSAIAGLIMGYLGIGLALLFMFSIYYR
ncbi:MAG TPA: protein kinase [Ktedonobacterales bacterium]|nr:protein kinase [Ktedonobacterales bacterium]